MQPAHLEQSSCSETKRCNEEACALQPQSSPRSGENPNAAKEKISQYLKERETPVNF